jgi:Putative porin
VKYNDTSAFSCYFCGMKRLLVLFLVLGLSIGWALAQIPNGKGMPSGFGNKPSGSSGGSNKKSIIDDTTKQIYGPKTVLYFLEEDVLNNRKTLYLMDTSYHNLHQYSPTLYTQHHLTDLGNYGTAARPVFFEAVQNLGVQLGYDAYTPYSFGINDVKYYDTKSPFTNMNLVLGGNGQNRLRFEHTRNINPRLNVGLHLQRMTTDKVYGTSGQSDAQTNLTQNWAFVLYSSYQSINNKYQILAQINTLNQYNLEQGGIVYDSSKVKTEGIGAFFEIENPTARLSTASSWYRNNRLHLYHQYSMAKGFELYHVFDYSREKNIYRDKQLTEAKANGVYPNYFYPVSYTNQDLRLWTVENKVGIKGRFQKFNYRLSYRQRVLGMVGSYNTKDSVYYIFSTHRFENFAGLWLSYFLKDSTQRVTAETELGNGLKIKGELITNLFSVGYMSILSPPTLIQQLYGSNHLRWDNADVFSPTNSNNIYGQFNLKVKNWSFHPRLDYHFISNYVYFDSSARAQQYSSPFSVVRVGGITALTNKRIDLTVETYLTGISNDKVLRIPKFFGNLHLGYDFGFPKATRALVAQIGFDVHYQSPYYANAYMPLTQQFYLQNTLKVEDYMLIDVFANFRISRARLFFKVANLTHRLANSNRVFTKGYFTSPLYPAMGRSLGFGVIWPLFD